VAQGEGHEFKPQYQKKKYTKRNVKHSDFSQSGYLVSVTQARELLTVKQKPFKQKPLKGSCCSTFMIGTPFIVPHLSLNNMLRLFLKLYINK
jgi:hypothetical protein